MEGAVRELNGVAGRVDGGRLWRRLMQMAEIGAIPGNGVNRQALSEEDIAARELLIDWARKRGYGVAVDDAANLFVRRPGSEPDLAPVLTGSHMDSQPRGGRFDGIYGVMAGLEALDALEDSGTATRRPVELVAWTNEEGSRFDPGCMGSMVFSGAAPLERFEDAVDAQRNFVRPGALDGRSAPRPICRGAANRSRRRPMSRPISSRVPCWRPPRCAIGAVTGVQGSQRFVVEVDGSDRACRHHPGQGTAATRSRRPCARWRGSTKRWPTPTTCSASPSAASRSSPTRPTRCLRR